MRVLIALSLLVFAASAVADDVHLTDGRVLSGKVVDEGKRFTIVDRDRKYAIPKATVSKLEKKQSFMDQYEARLAKLPEDDAEAIFEFGRWLDENDWKSRGRLAYQEVLDLDPEHRGARRALGYKLYEGEWLAPEELNRRKGLVLFDGRWYTKHDLEQLKKEIETNEKLRHAFETRRKENKKINGIVKKFATFDKKQRKQAYSELYKYAEQTNSPELRKLADDTQAYYDQRVATLCAQLMARTEFNVTHTRLKRPIENFETNLGAAISIFASQNPVTIQLPEIDIRQIQTTVDVPAGCK